MASESYNVVAVAPTLAPPVQPTGTLTQRHVVPGQAAGDVSLGTRATSESGLVAQAPSATEAEAGGRTQAGTVEQVAKSVERINEMMQNGRQTLTFQLDDDSGRMVIRVIDAQSKELIRQIPNEETLKFAQYVDGLVGLIFNKKA